MDVVVKLRDEAPSDYGRARQEAAQFANGLGISPRFVYGRAIYGFAASVPESALNGLRNHPRIEVVELDAVVNVEGAWTPAKAFRKPS